MKSDFAEVLAACVRSSAKPVGFQVSFSILPVPVEHRFRQPLTLDQAIDEAVANNLNLIAERYNLSVAKARIITARARAKPNFSTEGDHLDFARYWI